MSNFTTPANVRLLEEYKFELLSDFEYHVGSYPSDTIIRVPKGYITDLASTPRLIWWWLPPHGRYAKAAILHDYLYSHGVMSRKYADSIFLEAMSVLGVKRVRIYIMYFAVRLFGRGKY